MKNKFKVSAICAALAFQLTAAAAEPVRNIPVRSHPSQGTVVPIEGANASLIMADGGAFVSMNTAGLEPGYVYTLLLVVINDPDQCAKLPCTPKEVLTRSTDILSDVAYGGGAIADASGKAVFQQYQRVLSCDT